MKKILLPVDFSGYSEKAMDAAIILADDDATITLLNVYLDPLLEAEAEAELPPVVTDYTDKVIHRMEEEAHNGLDKMKDKAEARLGELGKASIKIETSLRRGIPEDVIDMTASEENIDMIVMGTRGLDETTRALFGSVTAKVIADAQRPVLAIPEASRPDKFVKLMYATNFDKADLDALSKLMLIFKDKPVNIHCVHFSVDTYAKDIQPLMDDLHNQIRHGEMVANLDFNIVECDDLEDGMEKYVKEHGVDLVAMTTHKRGFFSRLFNPSQTKKMLYHTHTPLLALHA